MKILPMILLMLSPIISFAQNPPDTNQGDMNNMMQQMQNMQSCMAKIDQKKVQGLEKKSNQFMAEVNSLCASGNREEAQEKAVSFAKEMQNNAIMKTMKKCSDMMKGMMPEMPSLNRFVGDPNQHICDVE